MFDNEQVISIVCRQLQIDEDTVDLDTDIMEDLGADSLDIVEMLMGIEDAFGIVIPDEDIEDIHTIGELCSYVESNAGSSLQEDEGPIDDD